MVSMSHFSNHHESDAVLGRDPDDWANRGPRRKDNTPVTRGSAQVCYKQCKVMHQYFAKNDL